MSTTRQDYENLLNHLRFEKRTRAKSPAQCRAVTEIISEIRELTHDLADFSARVTIIRHDQSGRSIARKNGFLADKEAS